MLSVEFYSIRPLYPRFLRNTYLDEQILGLHFQKINFFDRTHGTS